MHRAILTLHSISNDCDDSSFCYKPFADAPDRGELIISHVNWQVMKLIFGLFAHLMATVAKLVGGGGAKAVVAQNLLLKQQQLMVRHRRRRAPNLATCQWTLPGFGRCFRSRNGFCAAP
jgi:hypothetical protein